jgi:hypothetical protein
MLRRIASMLVMVGYLAGQLATVPHAHADDPRHEHHLAQPHIHLAADSGSSHAHEHGHEHGHVHRHATAAANRDGSAQVSHVSGVADHEADAIYLPLSVSTTVTNGADSSKLLTSLALLHFVDAAAFVDSVTAYHAALLRLPDKRAPECDFCLTLRALRI